LIAGATSLQGYFFGSVAFRYFHPDDVISGEGTRLHGGRFVPAGVRAVYASLEEETALREVTSRKSALGGRGQIPVGEYPRMTYVLSVATHRNLDLAETLPSELANVVRICLRGPGYDVSQIVADIWISEGIDSVVFPSATAPAETLQCIWQTPPLAVSRFAIVPKSWRLSADHVRGSVAGSDSFLTCRSRPCRAFSTAALRTDIPCENQDLFPRKQPTQLPTHGRVFST
jgi:RES domain-containing protein